MKLSKIASAITSMMMFISTGLQNFSTSSAATEQNADSTHSIISEDNMKIETTNSFGNLFASELSAKQEEQIENNGYNIFSIEMEDNVATVDYQVQGDCTLIVGIYDDSATTMIASGTAEVKADETLATVEIPVLAMPKYFYIKAYLVGTYTLEPLCLEYKNPNYTQHMQEFFSKTTDDFDQEKVINFDEDKTNNFAVYSDDVIIIPYEEGFNTSITYDEESGTYTIENASEAIQALKEGDLFAYDDEVLGPVTTKIGSISINGTTVTITIDDTDIHEVFDYVRIDTSQDLGDAEAECYNGAELVNLNTQENSTRVRMPGEPPIVKSDNVKDEPGVSYTFKHKFGEDPTEPTKPGEEDKDKDKTKPYVDVDGDLALTATLKITIGAVLNLDLDDYYMELNIDYESSLDFTAEGSVTLNVPIGYYKFEPVPGFKISLQPSVVFELSAEFTLNVTSEGRIGIKLQDGEVKNNSKWPVTKAEIKGEVSFFYGFRLNPKFTFISEKVLGATSTCEIGVKIGASIGGSVDTTTETDIDKIKEYHECKVCIDGDISFIFKMDFSIKFLKTTITLQPVNISPKIGDFYYSLDTDKFAFTECPNIYHKIKILVKDPNKDVLPNVKVECEPENAFKIMTFPYITENAKDLVTDEKGCVTVYARMGKTKVICTHETGKPKEYTLITAKDIEDNFLINDDYTTTFTCKLKPNTYTVKVNVTDVDNKPVKYPNVKYDSDGHVVTGDAKGLAVLDLYKGQYSLTIDMREYTKKTVNIDVKDDMTVNIQLEPQKYGTVKFKVKDTEDKPIQNVDIKINSYYWYDYCTDENGTASIKSRTGEQSFTLTYLGESKDVNLTVEEGEIYNIDVVFYREPITLPTTATTTATSTTTTTTTTTTPVSGNIVDSGTCGADGDNLTWTLDDEGTLIISGTGDMYDYDYDYYNYYDVPISPWNENNGVKNIIINDGVTSIGDNAFFECNALQSIIIPDSVTNIGENVFWDCHSLTSITIPDSVTRIGGGSFHYCNNLTSVTISNGITIIEDGTFYRCSNLTSITIPNSVIYISNVAFGHCDSLTSITIPNNVTYIGNRSFYECNNLESIIIENPNCEIEPYYIGDTIPDTTTIYGYTGSTAQAYAEEYGYEFVALSSSKTISLMQEEPIEILAEESVEVLAEEPTEILAEEPAEVLVEEPTETADDTADDSYILLEPAIHSFTDLLPNTVYNYYIMYNNTDLDILFNPGNIQYVSQFITDENGNAEVDLGYTEITEEAVKFTVPASVSEKNYKLGDVNGDGMVDAVDASYILRIYAVYSTDGTPEETEEQLLSAEVNGDGLIDAVDAAIVLAYYAHLSTGGTDDIETFISNNIDNTQ